MNFHFELDMHCQLPAIDTVTGLFCGQETCWSGSR